MKETKNNSDDKTINGTNDNGDGAKTKPGKNTDDMTTLARTVFCWVAFRAMRKVRMDLAASLQDSELQHRRGLQEHLRRVQTDGWLIALCLASNYVGYIAVITHVIGKFVVGQGEDGWFDYVWVVFWQLSSIINDVCVARISGLAAWRMRGLELGDRSLTALKGVAGAAKTAEEAHRLQA